MLKSVQRYYEYIRTQNIPYTLYYRVWNGGTLQPTPCIYFEKLISPGNYIVLLPPIQYVVQTVHFILMITLWFSLDGMRLRQFYRLYEMAISVATPDCLYALLGKAWKRLKVVNLALIFKRGYSRVRVNFIGFFFLFACHVIFVLSRHKSRLINSQRSLNVDASSYGIRLGKMLVEEGSF